MAWGDKAPETIKMILASGQPAAQDYFHPPQLPPHLNFYLSAFWDLVRHDGIPFDAIDRYATRYGITDVDAFDRFKTLVARMFAKWVEIRSKEDVEVDDDGTPRSRRKPRPRPLTKR